MTGPHRLDDDDEPFLPPRPEALIPSIRIDDVMRTLTVARHLADGSGAGPLPLLISAIGVYLVQTRRDPAAAVDGIATDLAAIIEPLQEWRLACQRPAGSA